MTAVGNSSGERDADDTLECRMARVQLLLLDCDGVLTGGGVTWSNDGVESKTFHIRDGLGIRLWQRAGNAAGIVTGRSSRVVQLRAEELGMAVVRQGVSDKQSVVSQILTERGLTWEQTAFVGDDLPDLSCVMRCGVGVAVADACSEVRAAAALVTACPGGAGAVREVVERLLRARGQWGAIVAGYAA